MTDQATTPIVVSSVTPLLELMGRAAMAIKGTRDQLRIVDGSRRMLGPKSPRPALDLKIISGKGTAMPVTFRLDGPAIHLKKTFADWHALDLSRNDQWHRSTLAGYLNMHADRLAAEVGGDDRAERWQRAKDLRVCASQIQNNGGLGGRASGLHWRLELEAAAKPENEAA